MTYNNDLNEDNYVKWSFLKLYSQSTAKIK